MPDWKAEIKQRLAQLALEPTREAAIVEELTQYLEDYYAELLSGGVTSAEAERRTRAELSGMNCWPANYGARSGKSRKIPSY